MSDLESTEHKSHMKQLSKLNEFTKSDELTKYRILKEEQNLHRNEPNPNLFSKLFDNKNLTEKKSINQARLEYTLKSNLKNNFKKSSFRGNLAQHHRSQSMNILF